jgi:hypothetical protein
MEKDAVLRMRLSTAVAQVGLGGRRRELEQLTDEESMIVLEPVAASGFEFEVRRGEKNGPAKLR